jgi:hypothetical protein
MDVPVFTRHEKIDLKGHPEFNEKWVQGIIAKDPSIIGLGDLEIKDIERSQHRAGRLDLLLRDPDSAQRYEVEIQLGATDESHIIRTIEYWDNERRKYPQYEHCAVIIAEDITSRFLNVISLFNGALPLIAIKMEALKAGENILLNFTTVLDKLTQGMAEEDEPDNLAPRDRTFWEAKASKLSIQLVDQAFETVKRVDPSLKQKYNKRYIGLEKSGTACNFVLFKPRQKHINFEVKLPKTTETDAFIKQNNLEVLEYKKRFGNYSLSLFREDVETKSEALYALAKQAYDRYFQE